MLVSVAVVVVDHDHRCRGAMMMVLMMGGGGVVVDDGVVVGL